MQRTHKINRQFQIYWLHITCASCTHFSLEYVHVVCDQNPCSRDGYTVIFLSEKCCSPSFCSRGIPRFNGSITYEAGRQSLINCCPSQWAPPHIAVSLQQLMLHLACYHVNPLPQPSCNFATAVVNAATKRRRARQGKDVKSMTLSLRYVLGHFLS